MKYPEAISLLQDVTEYVITQQGFLRKRRLPLGNAFVMRTNGRGFTITTGLSWDNTQENQPVGVARQRVGTTKYGKVFSVTEIDVIEFLPHGDIFTTHSTMIIDHRGQLIMRTNNPDVTKNSLRRLAYILKQENIWTR